MRPRLITAENRATTWEDDMARRSFNEAAAHHRGEPRQAAAVSHGAGSASMRPRLITAENRGSDVCRLRKGVRASMRPRLITAENLADYEAINPETRGLQ